MEWAARLRLDDPADDPAALARVVDDLVLPPLVRVALVDWLEARGHLPR